MSRADLFNSPAEDSGAEPFLRAVAENGEDNLPKLLFADWLDENGYSNAAHGMRWAAKYNKRPATEGDIAMYGWHLAPMERDTEIRDYHRNHTLPRTISEGANIYNTKSGGQYRNTLFGLHSHLSEGNRSIKNWSNFLGAAHHTPFSEDSEPLTRYNENQLGYQSDIRHQ